MACCGLSAHDMSIIKTFRFMQLKHLLFVAAVAAFTVSASAQDDYTIRTLTFEDEDYKGDGSGQSSKTADWSSLISDPQYGTAMLYGPDGQGSTDSCYYYWADDGNTMLGSKLPYAWYNWCYWSGGEAISNYNSSEIIKHGGYNDQLTVYNPDATDEDDSPARTGGGHDGSNNFCMHFGYSDYYNGCSEDWLPYIYFIDNVPRVIDHMYVNNSTYALNCYVDGNSLTAKIGENDWVKIVAIGYGADGKQTGTRTEMYLCNGPEDIVEEWTKFDLSVLGPVAQVNFNVTGSSDNGYGFSQPAYFAFDDVAVRFPSDDPTITGIGAIKGTKANVQSNAAVYNLAGQRVGKDYKGVVIINGKKVLRK